MEKTGFILTVPTNIVDGVDIHFIRGEFTRSSDFKGAEFNILWTQRPTITMLISFDQNDEALKSHFVYDKVLDVAVKYSCSFNPFGRFPEVINMDLFTENPQEDRYKTMSFLYVDVPTQMVETAKANLTDEDYDGDTFFIKPSRISGAEMFCIGSDDIFSSHRDADFFLWAISEGFHMEFQSEQFIHLLSEGIEFMYHRQCDVHQGYNATITNTIMEENLEVVKLAEIETSSSLTSETPSPIFEVVKLEEKTEEEKTEEEKTEEEKTEEEKTEEEKTEEEKTEELEEKKHSTPPSDKSYASVVSVGEKKRVSEPSKKPAPRKRPVSAKKPKKQTKTVCIKSENFDEIEIVVKQLYHIDFVEYIENEDKEDDGYSVHATFTLSEFVGNSFYGSIKYEKKSGIKPIEFHFRERTQEALEELCFSLARDRNQTIYKQFDVSLLNQDYITGDMIRNKYCSKYLSFAKTEGEMSKTEKFYAEVRAFMEKTKMPRHISLQRGVERFWKAGTEDEVDECPSEDEEENFDRKYVDFKRK